MSDWWSESGTEEELACPWPQVTDYLRAMERGDISQEGGLSAWSPVDGGFLGGPIVLSGRSAVVFCMEDDRGDRFALRCFLGNPTPNAAALCEVAASDRGIAAGLPPIAWHQKALRVDDEWWPAVSMPWREGVALDSWLWDHRDDPHSVDELAGQFLDLIMDLDANGIVHGDLQHGNLIVDDEGKLSLIDLDGLVAYDRDTDELAPGWVEPSESGHPNYQHPERTLTGRWSPSVDLFAALVIDLSIRAVARRPDVMERHYHEDNLLLSADDLADPDESKAIMSIREIEDQATEVRLEQLVAFCRQTLAGTRDARSILIDGEIPAGVTYSRPWWTTAPASEVVMTLQPLDVDDVQRGQAVPDLRGRPSTSNGAPSIHSAPTTGRSGSPAPQRAASPPPQPEHRAPVMSPLALIAIAAGVTCLTVFLLLVFLGT